MTDRWEWRDSPEGATGECAVCGLFKTVVKEWDSDWAENLQICADCAGRQMPYVQQTHSERVRVLQEASQKLIRQTEILKLPGIWPPT